MRLIEIIDAPTEAPFRISPCPKASDVQIANGQNLRSAGEIFADTREELRPPIVGGAEEGKDVLPHLVVLLAESRLYDRHA